MGILSMLHICRSLACARLYGLSEVPWGHSRSTTPVRKTLLLWVCPACRFQTMKFAKRLAAEASRKSCFAAAYLDYKALKKTIKDDISCSGKVVFAAAWLARSVECVWFMMPSMLACQRGVVESLKYPAWRVPTPFYDCADVNTASFQQLLQQELCKVSQFYSERADKIEVSGPQAATALLRGGPGHRQTPHACPTTQSPATHTRFFAKRYIHHWRRLATCWVHSSQLHRALCWCSCRPRCVRCATAAGRAPACSSSHSCERRSRS